MKIGNLLLILVITLATIASVFCATPKPKQFRKGSTYVVIKDPKNLVHIRIATHSSRRCSKLKAAIIKYKVTLPKADSVKELMKVVCSTRKVIPTQTLTFRDEAIKKTVVIQFNESSWHRNRRLQARAQFIATKIAFRQAKKKQRLAKEAKAKKKAAKVIRKAAEAKKKAEREYKRWKLAVDLFGHFKTVIGENSGKPELDHALIKGSIVISKNIKLKHNLTFAAKGTIKLQRGVDPVTTGSVVGEYRYFINNHYSVLTLAAIGHDKPKDLKAKLLLLTGIEWNFFNYHKKPNNQFKISLLIGPRGKWEYGSTSGYSNLIVSFRIKYQKPISKKFIIVLMAMVVQSITDKHGDMSKPEFILSAKLKIKDIVRKGHFKLGVALEATAKFYVGVDKYYVGEQGVGLSFSW